MHLLVPSYVVTTWCHWPSLTFLFPRSSKLLGPVVSKSIWPVGVKICRRHDEFPLAISEAWNEFALILKLLTLIQVSIVMAEPNACSTDESTIVTLFWPLKANACPTSPVA